MIRDLFLIDDNFVHAIFLIHGYGLLNCIHIRSHVFAKIKIELLTDIFVVFALVNRGGACNRAATKRHGRRGGENIRYPERVPRPDRLEEDEGYKTPGLPEQEV